VGLWSYGAGDNGALGFNGGRRLATLPPSLGIMMQEVYVLMYEDDREHI
jgi:hypothetical protein